MFSVIIPNYNHARFLKKRIDSVLSQTFRDFEVIILDDQSSDNSREIIERYNDERISYKIFNEENSGSPFKQWKKGLKFAKFDHIWIAESDDFCEATFLETANEKIKAYPKTILFYADSNLIGENEQPYSNNIQKFCADLDQDLWHHDHQMNGTEYVKKYLKQKNFILNASSVVFGKNAGLKHIATVENFKTSGDWLFWALLLSEGDVYFSSKKLNYFRHLSQSTRNYNTLAKREQRILEKIQVTAALHHYFVFPEQEIAQKKEELVKEWIRYHTFREFERKSFWKITKIPFMDISKFALLTKGIQQKLINRWKK